MPLRYRRVAVLAAVVVVAVSGCGSNKKKATAAASASPSDTHHQATRWWDGGAGSAGSEVDMANPTAAAASLTPNTASYCKVLSSSLALGDKSPLGNYSSNDPGSLASVEAWVAELTALAPTELTAAWKNWGGALVTVSIAASKPTPAFPSFSEAQRAQQTSDQQLIDSVTQQQCNLHIFGTAAASSAPPS